MEDILESVKIIPLRGLTVFPFMKVQFEIARRKTINAITAANDKNEKIFLVSQRKMSTEDPSFEDLYDTGVLCNIEKVINSNYEGAVRAYVTGEKRAIILKHGSNSNYLEADILTVDDFEVEADPIFEQGFIVLLKDLYDKYSEFSLKGSRDIAMKIFDCTNLGELCDLIAGNALGDPALGQQILDEYNPIERAKKLCAVLKKLIEIEKIKDDIESKVMERMDKSQREYYLREELRVIGEELGDDSDKEFNEYREKILKLNLGEKSEEKLLKECDKLAKMAPMSAEANVVRNYLDECLDLPWNKVTKENGDIEKARRILDRDHYSLTNVKDRFIEMLCAHKLGAKPNNQILCLIGPPGIGKTSIAKSVAKAMGRNFARISLGGVNDEAEIRGHRKTYIGAMPGRIISAIKQAGSKNCIILLDEVDKLGRDYKGDPASALLEVLDGEQNHSFVDHFIELPFDLSQVIFITTANDASSIPEPLYDRMEKIELESYTFEEKLNIAMKHLVKKQMKNYALTSSTFKMNKSAVACIIENYTREAGVRALEKNIGTVCRKAAVKIVEGVEKVTINAKDIEEYLSKPKYIKSHNSDDRVGVVNGLAWTAVGGEMLEVEAAVMEGTGKIEITGNLGDVMKESAKLAVSIVRTVCDEYKLDKEFYKNKDIHIHIPEGAVPKDGPSAGITLSTALLSALSGRKVRGDIAMTGEVSLTGRVMPIGGLKEKSMAAYKNRIKTVIIPKENERDLVEISNEVKDNVNFIPVTSLSQVFNNALI